MTNYITLNLENLTEKEKEYISKLANKTPIKRLSIADIRNGENFKIGNLEFTKKRNIDGGVEAILNDCCTINVGINELVDFGDKYENGFLKKAEAYKKNVLQTLSLDFEPLASFVIEPSSIDVKVKLLCFFEPNTPVSL